MKTIQLMAIAITLMLFSSCSKHLVPWTDTLANKYKNLDRTRIQFYNSQIIVLQKDSNDAAAMIKNGKIVDARKKTTDEVDIDGQTRGAYLSGGRGDTAYVVTFEKTDEQFLYFTLDRDHKYYLGAMSWKNNIGMLTYGTETYYTPSSKSFLLVDLRKIEKYSRSVRKAPGRKVR